MTSSLFKTLDSFLFINDHESMDWCDGGEYEVAEGYLGSFDEKDWQQLKGCWRERPVQWQGCLVSVLHPSYGGVSQDIILEMALSENPEIAFDAMCGISFYCGINANSDGQFIDESIVNSEFRERLRGDKHFLASIPLISKVVGRKYELLQQVLSCQP
ncbi:MAG: hypothetical protein ABW092_06005 [Candidatus Thiodiazotropha sp.]